MEHCSAPGREARHAIELGAVDKVIADPAKGIESTEGLSLWLWSAGRSEIEGTAVLFRNLLTVLEGPAKACICGKKWETR
jgi:hypothetical protein